MNKQICFLALFLMLATPCLAQMKPEVLESEGKGLSEYEQRILSLISGVSNINTGENIRNDIVWRKKWVEQLKETEETFHKILAAATDPPYALYYSTIIETGNINYQKETADLSIVLNLFANEEWFTALQQSLKAAQAVQDGLNATNRKEIWGLDNWPRYGVSETNPFSKEKYYDIPVEFELVNQQGRVIGKQTAKLGAGFSINSKFIIEFRLNQLYTLTFYEVKANDISDNLNIRLASVNGKPPETARFPITVVSVKKLPEYLTDSRDGKKYGAVEIGPKIWIAENLNFNAEGSKCYKNDPANCQKYGRLYNWNTAMSACPKFWHLPSEDELEMLMDFAGGNDAAEKNLKARSGWNDNNNGEDTYGFSALPGGSGSSGYSRDNFYEVGEGGYWWSSYDDGRSSRYKYMGNKRYFINASNYKENLYSVRCVKD